MPNYQKHVQWNHLLFLPAILLYINTYRNISFEHQCVLAFAFSYATLFMHPDLDIAKKTKLLSLKGLLLFPLRGYSYVFKHRGISHLPIIGTCTRVAWVLACIVLLQKLSFIHWDIRDIFYEHKSIFVFAMVGVVLADLCHIILDLFSKKRRY